jgi:MscS family membrane protein
MLENILQKLNTMNTWSLILVSLLITALTTGILYLFLSFILRPIFRSFERDIALATLNVSSTPSLLICTLLTLKITLVNLVHLDILKELANILSAILYLTLSYLSVQLFLQVFVYYLKEFTQQTEAMWDDVLLPILSAVVPVLLYITGVGLALGAFGIDLSGIWVALGGATFVLGFALQDILANFFSGIVLLIDTPFRFGDILRLEDGSIGMLRKIGIRVTQLYIFSNHCDVYIPNSVLQGQNITNLSRPTSFYYHCLTISIPTEFKLDEGQKLIEEIVLAHPDTLGDIDKKLEVIDQYYNLEECDPVLIEQQEIGKEKVMAEQAVNFKLEEVQQSLEALVVTMQFSEKGGLSEEEIENVQQEYEGVLDLMGFQVIKETNNNRTVWNFQESQDPEALIELIKTWYKLWLRDPNLLEEDQYLISDEWELKIDLLKKRSQRLFQKISNPKTDETRLDDYIVDFNQWLKEKLKAPRRKWQEPQIRMIGMNLGESCIELNVNFFVDDIKLEDGKRGDRVSSQIYQEIFRHIQEAYLTKSGIEEA